MAIANKSTFTVDEFIAEMEQADRLTHELPIASDNAELFTQIMYAGVQENYDRSSAADGAAWAPHAPSTVRRYGPHPLLILSGAMLAASTTTGVQGNYLSVSDRSITIGVDLIYAPAQQFGTDKIPARPFMDLPEQYIVDMENTAADLFTQAVVGG